MHKKEPLDGQFIDAYVNGLSDARRLHMLYYMIWIHKETHRTGQMWIRRPGRQFPVIGDQKEIEMYDKSLLKLENVLSNEEKLFLHKLMAWQKEPELPRQHSKQDDVNEEAENDIDKGIRMLNKAIDATQNAKDQFLLETEDSDVFCGQDRHDTRIPDKLPNYFTVSNVCQSGNRVRSSVIIKPLPIIEKLQKELPICAKRFLLSRKNHSDRHWPISPRLVNDLLFLISERFNRKYDRLKNIAQICFSLYIVMGCMICFPLTFGWNALRYFACFGCAVHFSFIFTEIHQVLAATCREMNGVTGRLGVRFKSKNVRLSTGLEISFQHLNNFITIRELIFVSGGIAFLRDFEIWADTSPLIPLDTNLLFYPIVTHNSSRSISEMSDSLDNRLINNRKFKFKSEVDDKYIF